MEAESVLRLGLYINNVIQSHPHLKWEYALSDEQVSSKMWLLRALGEKQIDQLGRVLILGGWVGLLGYLLLLDRKLDIEFIRSIDKDPKTVTAADDLNFDSQRDNWKFKAGLGDWDHLDYDLTTYRIVRRSDQSVLTDQVRFNTIINTCCEHMGDFTGWINRIPGDRLLILQSNSSNEFEDHVNCHNSLDEFVEKCALSRVLYSGELALMNYKRWMVIGYRGAGE